MDFPSGTSADLAALVAAYPLAWLVTTAGAEFEAVPLPLIAELDEEGEIAALIGHCSARNRQVEHLRQDSRAFALFIGPQGYISPAHVSAPKWVPTWNFAVAIFQLEVTLDEGGTADAVRGLTEHSEQGVGGTWKMEEAGERLPPLLRRIIGFRGEVVAADVRMKLGQEEDDLTLGEIIRGLGPGDLSEWMVRLNGDRLETRPQDASEGYVQGAAAGGRT
jgi:transcriptional regulator